MGIENENKKDDLKKPKRHSIWNLRLNYFIIIINKDKTLHKLPKSSIYQDNTSNIT